MEWVTNLYENHKFWFWVLIPVVAVIWIFNFMSEYQKSKAIAKMTESRKKDDELKETAEKLKLESKWREAEIETRSELIKKRRPEDTPLDWHKHLNDDD